jgi:hypothetical protein
MAPLIFMALLGFPFGYFYVRLVLAARRWLVREA